VGQVFLFPVFWHPSRIRKGPEALREQAEKMFSEEDSPLDSDPQRRIPPSLRKRWKPARDG
jgi:hypothetical protein